MRSLLWALLLMGSVPSITFAEIPEWIWTKETQDGQHIWLRKSFEVDEQSLSDLKSAKLTATCDNHFKLYLNGEEILKGDEWSDLPVVDISKKLKKGRNSIAVEAWNDGGIAAFIAQLRLVTSKKSRDIFSDESWKVTTTEVEGWKAMDFNSADWQAPKIVGKAGQQGLAWSNAVNEDSLESILAGDNQSEYRPRVADVTVPEGFQAEKVFLVPRSMGSWVALTSLPDGRLVASDQGGKGLFVITPGAAENPTTVEKLPVDVSGAQGLLWAFDSLYAVVSGGAKSGLHRITDSDGNGELDSSEHLKFIPGGGEHGPHAVILSPDGKSLHICAGNHTNLPEGVEKSRIPMNWSEDHLLPRRWDSNGHAAGKLAPGGWICKVSPDGQDWEVISMGFRNQYDIAFNANGELFSYDADMEWDLGSPWYRPTRVTHATSGSEFGWRSGTGKWPTYYEDSLPPVINIGPGSPVGITFGYGTKFPAKYQKALFILDWTYSTIYSIHLTPDGSSYSATKEDFATSSPLQVTDTTVGRDGAFYFTVGGRGTMSALYRVTYQGDEVTAGVNLYEKNGQKLRDLRQALEAFHGKKDADLELILDNLGHEDRFIRYAARIALEWQPASNWSEIVLKGDNINTLGQINGLMALSRQGESENLDNSLQALSEFDLSKISDTELLALLRTFELAFTRLGEPSSAWKTIITKKLEAIYPNQSDAANAELVQLLVYLDSPSVVHKTLDIMDSLGEEEIPDWGEIAKRNAGYGGTVNQILANMPPLRGIHFAFVLRNATEGWTLADRKRYFEFFLDAADHPGGNSYGKFLMQMREDAFATVPADQKVFLDEVASKALIAPLPKVPDPVGPGQKWTTETALAILEEPLSKRNFQRGRELFHATHCVKCHRYNSEGGAIGPDLSLAGKKFPLPDLLDNIFTPSKVVSDQFGSHTVVTTDGKVFNGRVVEIDDKLHIYLADLELTVEVIDKSDVEEMQVSKTSQMPLGLLNPLNEEELKDLLAYLLSGGDRNSKEYR